MHALLSARVGSLPEHVQSVYLHNALKARRAARAYFDDCYDCDCCCY